jgi:transcriptional regulator with XRE-family HTH domain
MGNAIASSKCYKTNEQISFDVKLGRKIRTYRTKNNLTQFDLAVLLDTDIKQIHRYEYGDISVNAYRLKKLSEIFGVQISELYK